MWHRVAGKGLIELYESLPVSSFLNGSSAATDKAIFQPGALRKVCQCFILSKGGGEV